MDSLLQIGLSNAVVATLLALLALVVGAVCRRPAVVHGLWLLVLLKLVTPPLVRVPVPWPVPADLPPATPGNAGDWAESSARLPAPGEEPVADASLFPAEGVEFPPVPEFQFSFAAPEPNVPAAAPFAWGEALVTVWAVGSVGWFLLAGQRVSRFQNLLRLARPAPPALRNRVERLARRLGLVECPGVWLIPGRVAPMLWAVGGPPRLLIPAELLNQVGREQQDTLFLHELAHLRRHDHWVRALEFLALGLYWWHPVAWLARRQLREVEEQCCDAWVVSLLPGAGRAYATALVETLDFLSDAGPAAPLLASGIGPVSDLKRRLTMIMRGTTPRSLGWGSTLALFALGALLLPALPTWARGDQKDDTKREIRVQVTTDEDSEGAAVLRAVLVGADEPEDIKKLQAEIERLRAELEKKVKALHEAQAKMKADTKKEARVPEARGRVIRIDAGSEGGKVSGVIRIEIVAPNINAESIKEMLKGFEKTLPGNIKIDVTPGPAPKPPAQPKPGAAPNPPVPPGGGGFGAGFPGGGTFAAPGGSGFGTGTSSGGFGGGGFGGTRQQGIDPRIEKLEKQLEEVRKELEALRKELKAPPRREERRPGAGAGADGQSADEARVQQAHKLLLEHLSHLRQVEAKAADFEKVIAAKQGAMEAAAKTLTKYQDELKAAEARLQEAKANLDRVKADKERSESLFEQGSAAKAEVEKAQATYLKALDQIKQVTEQNQKIKKEFSEHKDRAAAEKDLVKEAQKSKQDLEKEISRLKAQLAELEAKLKKESK
jgi:beta-lactamase regulating signal transducer with metallopeptidase domain